MRYHKYFYYIILTKLNTLCPIPPLNSPRNALRHSRSRLPCFLTIRPRITKRLMGEGNRKKTMLLIARAMTLPKRRRLAAISNIMLHSAPLLRLSWKVKSLTPTIKSILITPPSRMTNTNHTPSLRAPMFYPDLRSTGRRSMKQKETSGTPAQ